MGTRGGVRRGPDGKPLQGRKKGIPNKNPTKRQEARKAAIEQLAISEGAVLQEAAKIGFSNMMDYMTIGPDGLPHLDFSKLTREQAAAISELTVETSTRTEHQHDPTTGETVAVEVPVQKVKFKLANKIPGLDLLGKHLGTWKERSEDPDKDPLDASENEMIRQIAFILSRKSDG